MAESQPPNLPDNELIDILSVEDPELKGSYISPGMRHPYKTTTTMLSCIISKVHVYSCTSALSGATDLEQLRAGMKRKRPLEDLLYGGKRRSSRVRVRRSSSRRLNTKIESIVCLLQVRNVVRKKEEEKEEVNFHDAILKLLPRSLV